MSSLIAINSTVTWDPDQSYLDPPHRAKYGRDLRTANLGSVEFVPSKDGVIVNLV